MAIFVPIGAGIAAVGAAIGGAGVAITAFGIADTFRRKMNHTTVPVTHPMNLTEGDRISVKKMRNLPFKNAIVVGLLRDSRSLSYGKVIVVYHSGYTSNAHVEFMEVDLSEQAKKGELEKHQYEAITCYQAEEVAARAKSLCCMDGSPVKREVLRPYWSFFTDDEHFANWCQVGYRFNDVYNASMVAVLAVSTTVAEVTDYKQTLVTDVKRLSEGICSLFVLTLFWITAMMVGSTDYATE